MFPWAGHAAYQAGNHLHNSLDTRSLQRPRNVNNPGNSDNYYGSANNSDMHAASSRAYDYASNNVNSLSSPFIHQQQWSMQPSVSDQSAAAIHRDRVHYTSLPKTSVRHNTRQNGQGLKGVQSTYNGDSGKNRLQVFSYNHGEADARILEQESLKEQIRANILQQISPQYQSAPQGTPMPRLASTHNLRFNKASKPCTSGLNQQVGSYTSNSLLDHTVSTYSPNFNHSGSSYNQTDADYTRDIKIDSYSGETNSSSFLYSPGISHPLINSNPKLTHSGHNFNSPSVMSMEMLNNSRCSHTLSPMLGNTGSDTGVVENSSCVYSQKTRSKRPSTSGQDVGGKKKRMSSEIDAKKYKSGKKTNFQKQQPVKSAPSGNVYDTDGYHDNGANFVPSHQLPVPSRRGASPKDPCEQISKAIINYFLENQQTNAVFGRKMQLRDTLSSIIQSVFPYSGLYIVGSSLSGFGTKKSDIDLCLMISQGNIVEKKEAVDLLFALQKSLRKCSFVKNLEVIRARVPILRFRDKVSDVECDLNVNNLVGIRNTHLLKHYALMDWRIRPLGLFIKYWARSQNINDARNMTISSYSFALMLIHYLQCGCTPPVLPSLQVQFPREFCSGSDVCTLRPVPLNHQSPNNLSVGELFLGFLEYYTFTFDYKRDAISVRQGKILPIPTMQRQTSQEVRQWSCLCIEEPFELSNTARSVFDVTTFKRIQKVFRTSFLKLDKKKDVKAILSTQK